MSEPKLRLSTEESSEDETSVKSGEGPSPASLASKRSTVDLGFESGEVLAGRYRVVRRIGRGGMGTVYLVHDLTLDQEVALKFLPGALAQDPTRLSLFHNEVRVARRVTHKNVCRIFDIGEVDGRTYLSMEYVDGEDLASLLRRIGRLPEDKGLEIARQLCAGLAAAHDEGVIHRDLKPANVMLDGQGQVRITDFGLASAVSEIRDVQSGTPAYMAPEQLRGQEVSPRSDLYALGLILYEVFTGRRAFDADSVKERLKAQDDSSFERPSSAVRELSRDTESTILSCLSPNPGERPGSALEVAARLPGSDPLADALAAGRTPSPEIVAATGGRHALAANKAMAAVLATLLGVALFVPVRTSRLLIQRVPMAKPPEVLVDRAENIASALGLAERLDYRAFGFFRDDAYVGQVMASSSAIDRWRDLDGVRPGVLQFWLRSSPERLIPVSMGSPVSRDDPPLNVPGMFRVVLDSDARLVELTVVPDSTVSQGVGTSVDWNPWFEAAGVGALSSWVEVAPAFLPATFADERHAFEPRTGVAQGLARIEAATFGGRLVSFRVERSSAGANLETGRAEGGATGNRLLGVAAAVLIVSILVASGVLARRNVKLGRGDRSGANRIATVVFVLNVVPILGSIPHFADPTLELNRVVEVIMLSSFPALLFWMMYLALEPYVRRVWPHGLIAWNRLLASGYRDPLVGRDVLVGMVTGVLMALSVPARDWMGTWFGIAEGPPPDPGLTALLGTFFQLLRMLNSVLFALNNAILLVFLLVLLRFFFRRQWVATLCAGLVVALLVGAQIASDPGGSWLVAVNALIAIGVQLIVMVRFGFLAGVVAGAVDLVLRTTSLTLELESWYAGPTWATLLTLGVLAAYAFVASRAGEPLFGRRLLPD